MNFKLDENLPLSGAVRLRNAGHDATTVLEEGLGGAPDGELIAQCLEEGRAMITLDLDFSDIRTYPPESYAGIVVLRLPTHDIPAISAAIEHLIQLVEVEPLKGLPWILEADRVRVRGGAV